MNPVFIILPDPSVLIVSDVVVNEKLATCAVGKKS